MQLPVKYFLTGNNILVKTYLVSITCVPIISELAIEISCFDVPVSNIQSLNNALKANSSNKEFYDKINKNFLGKTQLSQYQSQTTLIELLNLLNRPGLSTSPNDILFVFRHCNPTLTLSLSYQNLKEVYDYLQDFTKNYNTWKMNYFSNTPIQQPQQNTIQSDIKRPVASIITVSEQQNNIQENVEISTVTELSFEKCLNDILSLITNNLILYFLNKYINLYISENKIEKEYNVSIIDNTLTISLEALIPNYLMFFGNSHYITLKRLYTLINSLPRETRQNNLINIFKQIIFISQFIINDPEKYKKDMHLILKLYDMLFFLYSLTFSSVLEVNNALICSQTNYKNRLCVQMETIEQPAINYLFSSSYLKNVNFKNVVIKHLDTVTYDDIDLETLKEVIKKNEYLKQLQDDEEYINTIKSEYFNTIPNQDKKIVNFEYNNQKIINIDNFINKESYPSPLLQYKLQPAMPRHEKIITEEYYQLLQLINNNITLDSSSLYPINKRYADILEKKILGKLFTDHIQNKSVKLPISTIDLLNKYISPNLPKDTSVEIELQILYRLTIPFLYDCCKINLYLDCFH